MPPPLFQGHPSPSFAEGEWLRHKLPKKRQKKQVSLEALDRNPPDSNGIREKETWVLSRVRSLALSNCEGTIGDRHP